MRLTVAARETLRQFVKFGIVGAAGFALDAALVYSAIGFLGFSRIGAGLFSFPFTVTFTWTGNRLFTFREAPPMPAARQLARFVGVCAIGLVFNRGTYSLVVSTVPFAYAHPVAGLLAGTGVGMFFNFFAARRHVFGL